MWPSRPFLCPWNFPGKNTTVGCHSPPPGDLPNPGIKPASPVSPALQVDSFIFIFSIYYFELKDKSFTIIFLFPPYINMNQSRCTCVPSLLNYPPTPHPIPPQKVVTEPWVEGSSRKFCFTCGNVCLSMVLCLFLLPSPPCPQACCLCLRLHCCLANRFINTIFLEYHIGVLIYDSFSLSDLLQSV